MSSKITVPLDGSTFSEGALRYACSLADVLGTKIELLTAYVPKPVVAGYKLSAERELASLKEYHKRLTTSLSREWDIPLQPVIIDGSPGDAIVQYVNDNPPDLVVMTSHGRGPFSRFWMGSVADQVLREAAPPAVIIRPEPKDAQRRDHRWEISNIVVALDGSKPAEQGLEFARRLGRHVKAKLTSLIVVPQPVLMSAYLPHDVEDTRALADEMEKDAEAYFDGLESPPDLSEKKVVRPVAAGKGVASSLVGFATEEKADLIVVTSEGRGGMGRMIFGSVADKVVRESDIPVLVVSAPNE